MFNNAPRRMTMGAWIAAAISAAAPGVAAAQNASAAQSAPDAAATAQPAAGAKGAQASRDVTVRQITVTARNDRIRISSDKRSYDITHDLQASTGSIADVLRNVPSVGVTPDGKVSLRGDTNVIIYVDGKPSSLFKGPQSAQTLQSLPADQYERVEVMTNPSAAYAPDGSAGIINLISKKTRKPGRSGSVRVAGATTGGWNAGVTANQKTDELTLSFNAGLRRDRGLFVGSDHRETFDGAGHLVSTLDAWNRSPHVGEFGNARGSAEWDPDAATQVTAELSTFGFRNRTGFDGEFDSGDGSGAATQVQTRLGDTGFSMAGVNGGLTLQRNFDGDGHTLVLSLSRDRTTSDNRQAYTIANPTPPAPDSYQDLLRGGVDAQTELKGDYTRPMPARATLKAGFDVREEADVLDNSGFLAAAVPTAPDDPGQTDSFRFKRRISALYATYDRPLGRFDLLAGLRWEGTDIDLDDVTTKAVSRSSDGRFYPTVHLGYRLSERQKLTASWSERVQRPWSSQYDPFRFVEGPFSERQGNPDLKPQETQQFELGYEYRRSDTYYLATAYYKDNSRGFTDVVTTAGGDVLVSTPENLARSRNVGVELTASGKLWRKLTYNVSGNVFHNELDAAGLGLAAPRAAWTQTGRGSLDWEIDRQDLLQLQASASGRRLTAQGYSDGVVFVNAGYRHKFGASLALLVTAQDVAGSYRNTVDTPLIRETARTNPHVGAAFVSLSWTFGGGPRREPGFDFGSANSGAQ